ncbi:hypothetical protein FQN57_006165 [Myotisia sp. PD_48]|nr:hypothetical protein FQN57_006165 [Myotisia sp. PD_48]
MTTSTPVFPNLQPAIFMRVNLGEASFPRRNPLFPNHNSPTGFIKSVDGFKPEIDATVMFGGDWLSVNSKTQSTHMNLVGLAQNYDGIPFAFTFDGIANLNEDTKHSAYDSGHKAVPLGCSTTNHTFRSGHESFKDMQHTSWIGNSRIVVAEDNSLAVECFVSRLVPTS